MKAKPTSKPVSAETSPTRLEFDHPATLIERNSIIRIATLCAMTGISRSMAYEKMKPQSRHYDSKFPRRIKIGSRSVGWSLQDVVNYIQSLSRV